MKVYEYVHEHDPRKTGNLARINRFAHYSLKEIHRLTVRPFSAVEKFNESRKDAVAFGQELKTDAVLEGTIQTIDNRVRVNLRLVDVKTGRQLWTDNFEETASDILKLQDGISGKVAQVLLIKLKQEEELLLAKNATTNPEAYQLYLIGREKWKNPK